MTDRNFGTGIGIGVSILYWGKPGFYSNVSTEIGQIIVASVNSRRIAELLNPDRVALRQLIEKK